MVYQRQSCGMEETDYTETLEGWSARPPGTPEGLAQHSTRDEHTAMFAHTARPDSVCSYTEQPLFGRLVAALKR